MSKNRCFVLYEREGRRNSAFIEVDDMYITGSMFESLKRHVSNLIADLYTDRYGYILIVDFKVIASVQMIGQMKRTVIVVPTTEIKEIPSIYSLLKMKLMELSKELEQKSIEIQELTGKSIDKNSSNRRSKQ